MNNKDIKLKLEKLKKSELKVIDNVEYFLKNIENKNKEYNIFLQINPNIKQEAQKLDEKLKKGENLGKLFGLCFAVKSNISVEGLNVSCASKTLENYKASYDADVIKKIKEEDGLILGIVNNDEFASGGTGNSSAFGKTINPIAKDRVPGGSSSGSAAAIAADFCDIALGSDTGGSIRNPASYCCVVGVKPSYGKVSRYGLIDLSMSLDQIGPLSYDIFGSALTLSVISGKSENDSISFESEKKDYTKIELKQNYKIGIIKQFENMIKDEQIKNSYFELIEKLKSENHQIEEISLDFIELAVQTYYPIVYTEFFSGTRKFDGIKYGKKIEESCGEEVLRRILGGQEISKSEYEGTYYRKALKVKEIIKDEFDKVFENLDFILTPVTPLLPPKLNDVLTAEENYYYDAFTIPANLAQICGGVTNYNFSKENIPIGFQILAKFNNEEKVFEGLKLIEEMKEVKK